MSNKVTKQAVVKPGGSIDPNKKTEVLQLFDESGDPIALDGSGGGESAEELLVLKGNIFYSTEVDTSNLDNFYSGDFFILNDMNNAGVYEGNGTTSPTLLVPSTSDRAVLFIALNRLEYISDLDGLGDVERSNSQTIYFPTGTDFTYPTATQVKLSVNSEDVIVVGDYDAITLGSYDPTLSEALSSIDDILNPLVPLASAMGSAPMSGTHDLKIVDGTLTWVSEG